MSKSFRELVEALNARSKKDEDDIVGPRAKGEKDFAASQGYPPKIGGKNDAAYPIPKTDDTLNARKFSKTKMHDNPVKGNETGKQPSQGTSTLKSYNDILKQTQGNRGDQLANGDKKIVRLSPTSVKGVEDSEDPDSLNEEELDEVLDTPQRKMRYVKRAYKDINKQSGKVVRGIPKVLRSASRVEKLYNKGASDSKFNRAADDRDRKINQVASSDLRMRKRNRGLQSLNKLTEEELF